MPYCKMDEQLKNGALLNIVVVSGGANEGKSLPSHAKQARRAGIALRILGPEARRGWVVSATPRPL